MKKHAHVYRKNEDGGVQLGGGADRWLLYPDHVDLASHHRGVRMLRIEAELKPFVDAANRGALAVIDMQNDFCAPGGWTDRSGLDHRACRRAIPGVQRAIEAARGFGMWVIWIYWHNRPDLRNLGAPTLHSFKHDPGQAGIGEELERGPVLVRGGWGAEIVDALKPHVEEEDVMIEKVRMSGFYGTHLDQVLRTQGINTLYFSGVNVDQCVTTTMEDAYFRDYNAVLLADACATSSPDYCRQAAEFNAKHCWGFVTTVEHFAGARDVDPMTGR